MAKVIESEKKPLPNPTAQMLAGDRLFDAIFNVIKTWDVSVSGYHDGYCGANGSHATLIYEAVQRENPASLLAANSRLHYRNQALSAQVKAARLVIELLTIQMPLALELAKRLGNADAVFAILHETEAAKALHARLVLLERAVATKDLKLLEAVEGFLVDTETKEVDAETALETVDAWRHKFFEILHG